MPLLLSPAAQGFALASPLQPVPGTLAFPQWEISGERFQFAMCCQSFWFCPVPAFNSPLPRACCIFPLNCPAGQVNASHKKTLGVFQKPFTATMR